MSYTVKTILYATSLGPSSPEVFAHAEGLARQLGARIHVVHAEENLSGFAASSARYAMIHSYTEDATLGQAQAQRHQQNQEYLETFCQEVLRADAGLVSGVQALEGLAAEVIVAEAERVGADLIVVGTHRHSALGEMLLGAVDHKVVMRSPVPVLLVPIG